MQTDIIKDILNLKENEGYNILNLGIKKDSNFTFVSNGDANFSDIYIDFLSELNILNIQLFRLFKEEILNDLEKLENEEELTTLNINVIADDKGNTISIYIPYDVSIYKEGVEELINSVEKIQTKLDKKLNKILDKFVDKEDDLKKFELVLKKDDNGNLKYYDFNRLTDRPISEQKQEIRELLSLDFEEKLINKAIEIGFNIDDINNKEVLFRFDTDMKEIFDLQIGVYDR